MLHADCWHLPSADATCPCVIPFHASSTVQDSRGAPLGQAVQPLPFREKKLMSQGVHTAPFCSVPVGHRATSTARGSAATCREAGSSVLGVWGLHVIASRKLLPMPPAQGRRSRKIKTHLYECAAEPDEQQCLSTPDGTGPHRALDSSALFLGVETVSAAKTTIKWITGMYSSCEQVIESETARC